jgi:hypothetical protein
MLRVHARLGIVRVARSLVLILAEHNQVGRDSLVVGRELTDRSHGAVWKGAFFFGDLISGFVLVE